MERDELADPRPQRTALHREAETPETLWNKCPGCSQMVFVKEYEENLSVCPACDHHGRIGPTARFEHLFDEGSWAQFPTPNTRKTR